MTECLGQNSGEFSLARNSQHRFELGIIYANPSIPNNITGVANITRRFAARRISFGGLTGLSQCASGVIVVTTGDGYNGLLSEKQLDLN